MKISVCIPVRNEEGSIRRLLDGLFRQTRRPDEIVITDGGSRDATPEIIEEYVRQGKPVRLIREREALPGRGRNLAAAIATSEWLAFIDAGVYPAEDWLASLAECVERDEEVKAVYGGWEPAADSFFKECAAIAYAYVPTKEVNEEFVRSRFIASSLIHRSVWERVGGFSERLRSAEDLLFMQSVDETGARVAYAPGAAVLWSMPPTFWRTFKRFVTYSRHNLRAGFGRGWQAAIFTRYGLLLLCALAASAFTRHWIVVTAALWLLMLLARSVIALWRNRRYYPAGLGRNTLRVFVLVPLLATLDLATILGTLDWVVRDRMGRAEGVNN
ncbi:MAG TPA: glycosyltransferase [Pyrinomonadaceae bacterium]